MSISSSRTTTQANWAKEMFEVARIFLKSLAAVTSRAPPTSEKFEYSSAPGRISSSNASTIVTGMALVTSDLILDRRCAVAESSARSLGPILQRGPESRRISDAPDSGRCTTFKAQIKSITSGSCNSPESPDTSTAIPRSEMTLAYSGILALVLSNSAADLSSSRFFSNQSATASASDSSS